MAAILDLMIAELLPRLWTSTSLIFHVYGPIDQVQVRNSPNTCLRTGLQAKDRITSNTVGYTVEGNETLTSPV